MGLYDTIHIESGVDLPELPDSIDQTAVRWQTKDLGRDMHEYRLSADGELQSEQRTYRMKTDEEQQAEAEQWGFNSWDAYIDAYDSHDAGDGLYPDAVQEYVSFENNEPLPPSFRPTRQTLDESWWETHPFTGTLTFYKSFKRMDEYPDISLSYEVEMRSGRYGDITLLEKDQ